MGGFMTQPMGSIVVRWKSRRGCAAVALAAAAILAVCILAPVVRAEAGTDDIEWSEPARLATKSLLLDVTEAGGRIFVVGDRGQILLSDDGGATWTQARVPTRSMLNAVAAVDKNNAWAVGHDTVIVHTSDGGKTWDRQYWAPEEACPLFDVWFENANHGLAVGAYGYVLVTDDGGKAWKRLNVDKEERHWYSIAETPDGTLFVAAEFGTVFRSDDKGMTWEALPTPYGGTYFGALALKDGALLIFGMRAKIFRTVDGGRTWTPIKVDTTDGLQTGLQLADGTVAIGGLGGAVLLSKDDGKRFETTHRPDRLGISSMIQLESGGLILVGEEGIHRVEKLP